MIRRGIVRIGAPPNLLAVAGSDPSGGAGIQADLKTAAALGCHGMAVVTALTAQNTTGVSAVHLPPADFVGEQIRMILADIAVAGIKIGMLGSAAIVAAVAEALEPCAGLPIVLDPVLVATSGAVLGDDAVIDAMRQRLVPLATLVTPNLAETARLAACRQPATDDEMDHVARRLKGTGRAAWLVKGGHGDGTEAVDILIDADDRLHRFAARRVATCNTHGTGCTLSTAIAAGLASGLPLVPAIAAAKDYLGVALRGADALDVGRGPGPLDHFARWRDPAG